MIHRQALAARSGRQVRRRRRTWATSGYGGQAGATAGLVGRACLQCATGMPSRSMVCYVRRRHRRLAVVTAKALRRSACPARPAAIFRTVGAAPLKLCPIGSMMHRYGHSAPWVRPHWSGGVDAVAVSPPKRNGPGCRVAHHAHARRANDAKEIQR